MAEVAEKPDVYSKEIAEDKRHYPCPYTSLKALCTSKGIEIDEKMHNFSALDSICTDGKGSIQKQIFTRIEEILTKLRTKFPPTREVVERFGSDIYRGMGGVSLLLLRLCKVVGKHGELRDIVLRSLNLEETEKVPKALLQLALEYNIVSLTYAKELASNRVLGRVLSTPSFLTGIIGLKAIQSILLCLTGDNKQAKKIIDQEILTAFSQANKMQSYELLFGKTGFLSVLFIIDCHLKSSFSEADEAVELMTSILRDGQTYTEKHNINAPVMYEWSFERYFGAAHGVCGILYILLQSPKCIKLHKPLLLEALDFCRTFQFPSGNYAVAVADLESGDDVLVHWCHGAPGFAMLFARAFQIFKSPKYLEWAIDAQNIVWERGLLRFKERGLCHGICGNAYAFLSCFKITKDIKYVYRAMRFAEFCTDKEAKFGMTPDSPASLFEGMSGECCFYLDLMFNPGNARFPAFDF